MRISQIHAEMIHFHSIFFLGLISFVIKSQKSTDQVIKSMEMNECLQNPFELAEWF